MLSEIIKKMLGKTDKKPESDAEEIMINRNKIPSLFKNMDKNPETLCDYFINFHTLPVYNNSKFAIHDEIIGCYTINNFLKDHFNKKIFQTIDTVAFIAPTTNIQNVYNMIFEEKKPLLAVVDGFGSIQGFINKEIFFDFLYKELFQNQINKLTTSKIRSIKGDVHFDDIKHIIKIPHFEKLQSSTVGGLIMEYLGYIPKQNEEFILDGYKIRILQSNNKYISEVSFEEI